MSNYQVKLIENKKVWDTYLISKNVQSFLQSWNWGESNKELGHKIFRMAYYDKNKIVGLCLLIKQSAKRGPHLLIPGGPIIDWNNKKLVSVFVKSVREIGTKEKVWFVRIRPETLDNQQNRNLFRSLKMIEAPMHLNAENTWVLDITLKEDELLQGMRKSTRYLIRKSMSAGLDLKLSQNVKDCKILFKLQKETVDRHKFIGFSLKTFETQLENFGKDSQATLFTCYFNSKPVASAIIIFFGDTAYYHHSGSSTKHKDIPSMYFLQWEIIKEAKKRGCKYYNFWGVAPNDNPKHRFAGVTLFKTGFGGTRIDWLHAHDLPLSKKYWATHYFERLRKRYRNL